MSKYKCIYPFTSKKTARYFYGQIIYYGEWIGLSEDEKRNFNIETEESYSSGYNSSPASDYTPPSPTYDPGPSYDSGPSSSSDSGSDFGGFGGGDAGGGGSTGDW